MHGPDVAAGTGTERIDAVLLVEADPAERERIGSVLERCGYEVSVCPGPTGPDYTCVGAREGGCALTVAGATIVLDMSLDSEAVLTGTAAEELLGLYLFGGHRIVMLGSHPGADIPGQLIRLPRHPEASTLIAAIRSLERHPTIVGL
jgi:hypothetical protein